MVCARQWIFSNESALAALSKIEAARRTEVAYEDFIADPVAHTERLLAFLELDPAPRVRERAEAARTTPINVVTPPEAGKWRRENPAEIAAVEELLAPTMEKLGYAF